MVETAQDIYSLLSKPYALLILAFTLDLCIGDPGWLPHPVRIMGKAITKIEGFLSEQKGDSPDSTPFNKLRAVNHHTFTGVALSATRFARNSDHSSPPSQTGLSGVVVNLGQSPKNTQNTEIKERWAGILLVVIITGSTFALFYIVNSAYLTSHFSLFISYFSLLVMVYLISTTIAVRSLIDSARFVIEAVKDKDIDGARLKLKHIVGRDTDSLEEKSILRATIESLSENASDGIIAPLFYFAIGGLPLAMTYKAINTMDSMVGYKNDRYRNFGWAAARLDDIANYIPARITGILIVISSTIVSRSLFTVHCSLKTMLRDGRKHTSPNSGVPEAAMAGALGIKLGGPSMYSGTLVEKPYIGENGQNTEHRIQNTDNLYFEASGKAIIITKIVSLLGLSIAIAILYVRTAI